jgi:hypothetical protein
MDPSTLTLQLIGEEVGEEATPVVLRDEEHWLTIDAYKRLSIRAVALGNMQLEWLHRFDDIQLDEWRYWYCTRTRWTGWVYVGEWPRRGGSATRKQYAQRAWRLKQDVYCYWPKAPVD